MRSFPRPVLKEFLETAHPRSPLLTLILILVFKRMLWSFYLFLINHRKLVDEKELPRDKGLFLLCQPKLLNWRKRFLSFAAMVLGRDSDSGRRAQPRREGTGSVHFGQHSRWRHGERLHYVQRRRAAKADQLHGTGRAYHIRKGDLRPSQHGYLKEKLQ